jgi:hypothetical protein
MASTLRKKVPTISIHGRDYITVATRVQLAHEDLKDKDFSITTEIVSQEPVVVIKATVSTVRGSFTGISAANPAKLIEKQNPYEVAETSAVGRALGFAGYGSVESIASADEMYKSNIVGVTPQKEQAVQEDFSKVTSIKEPPIIEASTDNILSCEICGQPAEERKGTTKGGKPWHGIFCSSQDRTHTRFLWN